MSDYSSPSGGSPESDQLLEAYFGLEVTPQELPSTLSADQTAGLLALLGELNAETLQAHKNVDPFTMTPIREKLSKGESPTPEEIRIALTGAQNFGRYEALAQMANRVNEVLSPVDPKPEA